MKTSNDTIENQTHDLSACSAVPQPTDKHTRVAQNNLFVFQKLKLSKWR